MILHTRLRTARLGQNKRNHAMQPDNPSTIVHLFQSAANRGAKRAALHLPVADGASFQSLNWIDLSQEVRRLAAGLCRAGVQPGDRVAQISENRYEWILLDLAVHLARGVHVAIHSVLSGQQIAFQIADSGARIVVLSTTAQADKLVKALASGALLSNDLQFYCYDSTEVEIGGQPVQPFTELFAATGRDAADAIEKEALNQTKPGELATILYTSGTTGEGKGVMLSHGNLVSNAKASCAAFENTADDVRLCWLPLSHVFARTADLYTWLVRASQLALAESREKIIAHCGVLHPTLMNGVPFFFEKVARGLIDAGKLGPVEPGGQTYLQRLLGEKMRACCSGGAALPDHVAKLFWQEGVPLVQGYGLTESSPVISTCTPDRFKLGSVGPAVENVEIKITDDGEILTRGPHVMLGYWNRPAETAAAIEGSWLRTGDLGFLDADGYLFITGRKKELIVTAGGKNIAPLAVESLLVKEPLIYQAIVIGEGRRFLTALIVPNPDALRAEIIARKIPVPSAAEALVNPEVLKLYRERIDSRLANLSECEQIQRFALLPRAFDAEHEEVTPTLKLRRAVIHDHFAGEIQSLYSE
ncbi:MAG TPA: AMP-dependent synthetase/ligase [Pirellulales bacterium]